MVFDNGGEFTGLEFQELLSSYAITARPTTVRNPQSNAVIERMHLTMADMLRTVSINVQDENEDEIKTEIDNVFQAVAWSLRTTVSTVTKVSPGQVVFGRDMIFDFKIRANWEAIEKRRLEIAQRNNVRENRNRIAHDYKRNDKILLANDGNERRKIGDAPFLGPYVIEHVYDNGTVRIKRNRYSETVNIRRIKPFNDDE